MVLFNSHLTVAMQTLRALILMTPNISTSGFKETEKNLTFPAYLVKKAHTLLYMTTVTYLTYSKLFYMTVVLTTQHRTTVRHF